MKVFREIAANDGIGPVCPMCGEPAHVTKASTLACSQGRRKEFAELSALVRKPKPKKPAS